MILWAIEDKEGKLRLDVSAGTNIMGDPLPISINLFKTRKACEGHMKWRDHPTREGYAISDEHPVRVHIVRESK